MFAACLVGLSLFASVAFAQPPPPPPPAPLPEPARARVEAPEPARVRVETPEYFRARSLFLGLPPDIAQKLTAEQIVELQRAALAYQQQGPKIPSQLVGALSLGLMFLILASVGMSLLALNMKDRRRHDTLKLIVEKGGNIPPELITPRPLAASDLRRGIVLLAFGLGLTLFIASIEAKSVGPRGIWALGLIPTFVGLAFLLYWKLSIRKREES